MFAFVAGTVVHKFRAITHIIKGTESDAGKMLGLICEGNMTLGNIFAFFFFLKNKKMHHKPCNYGIEGGN